MSEKQNGRQMLPGKLNNDYKFPNKSLRDLILVSNYMFLISRNIMEYILNDSINYIKIINLSRSFLILKWLLSRQ